jgi:membrane protease YdiL (CAAX protease family)
MTGGRGDPKADVAPEPGVQWRVLAVVVALLAVSNVIVNRFLPAAVYVPWNLAVVVLLVLLARRAGLTWPDLGLDRRTVGRSVRWGAAVAAVIVTGYVVAIALPATRALFDDARAGDERILDLLYHALVQIPLGTVLLEEVAFRGVLPALLGLRGAASWRWAPVVGASVLFGLWHVLPSLNLAAANQGVEDAVGGSLGLTVALAVLGTTIVGVFLCRLRWLGRGLLAPVIVHLVTNSSGFTIAWFMAR